MQIFIDIWNLIIIQPMINSLVLLYSIFFLNFGIAIIAFTLIVRAVLIPLTVRRDIHPLFIQFPIWIGFFHAVTQMLPSTPERLVGLSEYLYPWLPGVNDVIPINSSFLWLDLAQPDTLPVMPVLVGISMFLMLKTTTMPSGDIRQVMLWIVPLTFAFFTITFPSGLALYWIVSNFVGMIIQGFVTGWRPLIDMLKFKRDEPVPALVSATGTSTVQTKEFQTIFSTACPRCCTLNEPSSVYCYSCGLPLDELADSPQPSPAQSTPSILSFSTPPAQNKQVSIAQPAGFWIRLAAYLIDILLVSIIFGVIVALGEKTFGVFVSDNYSINEVIYCVLFLIYCTVAVSTWSTTIGKRAFRLHVLRLDGSKISFGRAAARCLCYGISSLFFGIGFLMIAFRKDKRGFHDLICGTIVTRR